MSELINKSIDAFRTAPIGISRIGLSTAGLLADIKLLINSPEVYEAIPLPLIAASIAIGGLKTAKQHRLKARLENSIEENGYDDRVFAVTTAAWCVRQTARVVCSDNGHLPEYEALCESEGDARLKWLPHVP